MLRALAVLLLAACAAPRALPGQAGPPTDTSNAVDDTAPPCIDTGAPGGARRGCSPPVPPGLIEAYAGAPGAASADVVTCWTLSYAPDVRGVAVLRVGMEHGAVEVAGVVAEGRAPRDWHAPAIIKEGQRFWFVGRWRGLHRLQRVELGADRLVVGPVASGYAMTRVGAEALVVRPRSTWAYASAAQVASGQPTRTVPGMGGGVIGTDGSSLLMGDGGWAFDPVTGVLRHPFRRLENVRSLPWAVHGFGGRVYGVYDVNLWDAFGQRIAVHDAATGAMLANVAFPPGFVLPGVGAVSLAGLWCE